VKVIKVLYLNEFNILQSRMKTTALWHYIVMMKSSKQLNIE